METDKSSDWVKNYLKGIDALTYTEKAKKIAELSRATRAVGILGGLLIGSAISSAGAVLSYSVERSLLDAALSSLNIVLLAVFGVVYLAYNAKLKKSKEPN